MSRRLPSDDDLFRLVITQILVQENEELRKGEFIITFYQWTIVESVLIDIIEQISEKIQKGESQTVVYQWALKELSESLADMVHLSVLSGEI